jgi:2,5-dichloro-2,5-cyclohexadiene-1,4-diol dehydrogenase 1
MVAESYRALDMTGRVVIVTGGGSGIGKATALLLGARGASIVVADLDAASAEATSAAICTAGGQSRAIRADVSVENDVKAMVTFAITAYGALHGAFNNAGISSKGVPLVDMPVSDWHQTISVNLTSVFLCMKYEIGHMVKHGGGSIVNTTSNAGVVGFPNRIDYVASKHGVVGLTRAAAIDYSRHGVRINAVQPGGTETPKLVSAIERDPAMRKAIESTHPIGRAARPVEIGEATAWLLSDAASFVTGAVLAVDGGYTCA